MFWDIHFNNFKCHNDIDAVTALLRIKAAKRFGSGQIIKKNLNTSSYSGSDAPLTLPKDPILRQYGFGCASACMESE